MQHKIIFLFVTIVFAISINAQKSTEKFYDYNFKETVSNTAQFYSMVTKTDSGYLRKDYFIREQRLYMAGLYTDSACKIANGFFKYFHPNGILSSYGNYKNGKKEGLWFGYHINKMMSDSSNYSKGKKIGTCMSWYENGFPSDSLVIDEKGAGVEVTFTNEGGPSSAGRYSESKKKEGKWVYFHSNGKRSAIEIYHENQLLDKQYFSESGDAMSDTTNNDRIAEFSGGKEAWSKWLTKRIYFPPNVKIVNAEKVAVGVSFTVNEKGKIENAFVSTPFEGEFNRIALNAILESPNWIPARNHNRTVPYRHRQIIFFAQKER